MMVGTLPLVLVVDDDPLVIEALSIMLQSSGFQYRAAVDGFEALKQLFQSTFDILITDLRMPNVSGVELVGIIRQRFPQLPVIVLSSEPTENIRGLKLPIEAVFQKDRLTPAQLISTMRKLLVQSKKQPHHDNSRPAGRPGNTGAVKTREVEATSKSDVDEGSEARPVLRMAIQDETFEGFRVRGLFDRREKAWRIKTWPCGPGKPEHDYWVRGQELFNVDFPIVSSANQWQPDGIGARKIEMNPEERKAILALIRKWEVMAQLSA